MGPDEGKETQSRQGAVGLRGQGEAKGGGLARSSFRPGGGPALSPAGSAPRLALPGLPHSALRSPSQELAGRPAVLCLPALRPQPAQEVLALPHLLPHPLPREPPQGLQLLRALGQLLPEPGGHGLRGLQLQAQVLPRAGVQREPPLA